MDTQQDRKPAKSSGRSQRPSKWRWEHQVICLRTGRDGRGSYIIGCAHGLMANVQEEED